MLIIASIRRGRSPWPTGPAAYGWPGDSGEHHGSAFPGDAAWPRGVPFVETLYDANTSSGQPLLPFEVRQYLSYATYKDAQEDVYPDAPVTPALFPDDRGGRSTVPCQTQLGEISEVAVDS